jgi:competence protein ComGC
MAAALLFVMSVLLLLLLLVLTTAARCRFVGCAACLAFYQQQVELLCQLR